MTDDIVTRLRERTERSLHTGSDVPSSLMLEAADEIERLREEVNTWRKIAELFAESHPSFDAFHSYFKEVRNG